MGFSYEVMDEHQAMQERFNLLKEGDYDAVITKSVDTISANSGNNMMDMTLSVYDDDGKSHSIRDFLVFTKAMMWKVVHCAESAGVLKEYEEQNFCSELMQDRTVRVKIVVEEGGLIPEDKLKGKAAGSKYPDKNKVEDYLKKEEAEVTDAGILDDDIAF